MKTKAYAKINLSLNITGTDDRGYHTLESIFMPIDFYDLIEIEKSEKPKYSCNRWYIKFDSKNTIVKAVDYMKEKYNIADNFSIKLTKHIPTQAGLGGGSSDGAAVIKAINEMYKLNMTKEEIEEACTNVGSDVCFTYYNKTAFVSGCGEKLDFFDVKDDYYVLIVKPKKGISTQECYDKLNLETCLHPDINNLKNALISGDSIDNLLGNSLEEVSICLLKDIEIIKNELIKNGASNSLMSGSGSSVFTISKDFALIEKLQQVMKDQGYFVRSTKVKK